MTKRNAGPFQLPAEQALTKALLDTDSLHPRELPGSDEAVVMPDLTTGRADEENSLAMNDVLTDVELGARPPAEGRNSSAIHQHEFSVWENDQQTIALAYINCREFQSPVLDRRRKRVPDEDDQERQDQGHHEYAPAPACALN